MSYTIHIRKRLHEELDKMSSVNLKDYYERHADNREWLEIISKFPEGLQREIAVEREDVEREDIEQFRNYNLQGNSPITVNLGAVLKNNLESLERVPQEVLDVINKKWGTKARTVTVYDQDPDRYFRYSEMKSNTAKPSVMVDGEIIWGVGRFIASLVRGDKSIAVWDLRSN